MTEYFDLGKGDLVVENNTFWSKDTNFQKLFANGMKRDLPDILEYDGITFNIGSSSTDTWQIPNATPLGRPEWIWPNDQFIPAQNNTVSTIHCYHFLEHLTGDDAITFLRECERVMKSGASVLNFCMPYYNSNLQAECLDHRSSWNENSFRNLFENTGFDMGKWKLRVHFQLIAGVVERNLCLIGQLIKE